MDAIGGFALLSCVSENRPVSVWKGRDIARSRDVAVKKVELTSDATISRMRAQARVFAGVSHPGLVEVVGLVEDTTHAWLIEEWIEGVSVESLVGSSGPLTPRQVMAILVAILPGLAHAHARGIVHGEICPSNVMVDAKGNAKLVNFGVSTMGQRATPQSDVRAASALLDTLLDGAPFEVEVGDDADRFHQAVQDGAVRTYGADWADEADVRALADLVARVRPPEPNAAPPPIPVRDVPRPAGSGSSVQVRSTSRAAKDNGEDLSQYLETRTVRKGSADGRAGRFIPLIAAAAVVAAIAVLVATHQETKSMKPGLALAGDYSLTLTLQASGVGAQGGQPAGSVVSDSWTVTSTCSSGDICVATVKPAKTPSFTLLLVDDVWTGSMPMASTCPGGAAAPGAMYVVQIPSSGSDAKVSGHIDIVAGCGPTPTPYAQLTARRVSA